MRTSRQERIITEALACGRKTFEGEDRKVRGEAEGETKEGKRGSMGGTREEQDRGRTWSAPPRGPRDTHSTSTVLRRTPVGLQLYSRHFDFYSNVCMHPFPN